MDMKSLSGLSLDESKWYYNTINVAKDYGIAEGVGQGKFNPEATVTRQEMATILGRVLLQHKDEASYEGFKAEFAKFKDATSVADWAIDYTVAMHGEGIIKGYPDNTFKPKANGTKAEAAKMICGVIENLGLFKN